MIHKHNFNLCPETAGMLPVKGKSEFVRRAIRFYAAAQNGQEPPPAPSEEKTESLTYRTFHGIKGVPAGDGPNFRKWENARYSRFTESGGHLTVEEWREAGYPLEAAPVAVGPVVAGCEVAETPVAVEEVAETPSTPSAGMPVLNALDTL